jgi:hypothetical protein
MPADRIATDAHATGEGFVGHNGEERIAAGGPVPLDEGNADGANFAAPGSLCRNAVRSASVKM